MRPILFIIVTLLTACVSNDQAKITEAVTTPLNDLSLFTSAIPETLVLAQRAPYMAPTDSSCLALAADIRDLDEVLGPDLDAPASDTKPSLIERGATLVVGAIQKTAEGAVPFRSWVRKLSGAERNSKQLASAISAGMVRRAYLNGIAYAKSCFVLK